MQNNQINWVKVMKFGGIILIMVPITFKILMLDNVLYRTIISGPYPFNMFGSGPFQFWVFGGSILLGISIVLSTIFASKIVD